MPLCFRFSIEIIVLALYFYLHELVDLPPAKNLSTLPSSDGPLSRKENKTYSLNFQFAFLTCSINMGEN